VSAERPRVYVVQQPLRLNSRGEISPKFDLSPAAEYGEVVNLLSSSAKPFDSKAVIAEMASKLAGYCDDDYLLLTGNPCLIGWATSIAAHHNGGRVRMLQWSGTERRYVALRARLPHSGD